MIQLHKLSLYLTFLEIFVCLFLQFFFLKMSLDRLYLQGAEPQKVIVETWGRGRSYNWL